MFTTHPVVGDWTGEYVEKTDDIYFLMADDTLKAAKDIRVGDILAASDGAVVVQTWEE